MAKYGYTLVQHSAFGYAGKSGFYHAVETRSIDTARDRDLIHRVGGVLMENGYEIDQLEERVNYPEGTEGLYPKARGTFSDKTIDGLRIYIPVTAVVG